MHANEAKVGNGTDETEEGENDCGQYFVDQNLEVVTGLAWRALLAKLDHSSAIGVLETKDISSKAF